MIHELAAADQGKLRRAYYRHSAKFSCKAGIVAGKLRRVIGRGLCS